MTSTPLGPREQQRELIRLVRRIQALTLEIQELRQRDRGAPELAARERTLEQLRWRLAAVARRTATDDLDAAA
jgi:hypothetical protein